MIAERMKSTSHMRFNCIFGQAQLICNFPVGVTLRPAQPENDLTFFGQGSYRRFQFRDQLLFQDELSGRIATDGRSLFEAVE